MEMRVKKEPKIKAFNPRSSQQIAMVCKGLGINLHLTSESGRISTNAQILAEFKDYPFIARLLEYKKLQKHVSTYLKPMAKDSQVDNKIYPQYHQCFVETNRLSSSSPNIQNITKHSDMGKELRKCFIPMEGHKLVSLDFGQLQLRILAHYSQDPALLEIYRTGQDLHQITADELGIDRNPHAKAVNFGFAFGMMPPKFRRDMKSKYGIEISKEEAERYYKAYFTKFKKLDQWRNYIVQFAKAYNHCPSLFGFKRPIDMTFTDKHEYFYKEHCAINTPIMASESQVVKLAMIAVYNQLGLIPWAHIHDDLTYEIPDEKVDNLVPLIKQTMESVNPLSVPLIVEHKIGHNWSEI
jgi:DNA polymerase-1